MLALVLALVLALALGLAFAGPGLAQGYQAKDAVYEFEAETIRGRTLKPRLPFRKFRYQQPLMISPPASQQQPPEREPPAKASRPKADEGQ